MSHTAFTYHLVFGTHRRERVIFEDHEKELYKFIYDLAAKYGVKTWRIGGMPDHVHMLCDIPGKIAVADFVKLIKTESSKFMRTNEHFPAWRGWSEGYGGFSVDASSRNTRIQYIINQKEHHRTCSFMEEYRAMLKEEGIELPFL